MGLRRDAKFARWGETQACYFLQRQGFVIVDRNYNTTQGEIDVVARKGDDYYFVEVKTRHIGPMAYDLSITKDKKYKMHKTVKVYCYRKQIADVSIILAGLMVVVDRSINQVKFRLAVLY